MRMGIIFDIQYYCLHDGPGIRTVVFLKGCPLRCAWCHNPESQKMKPEIGYLKDKCIGCGKCFKVCPNKALKLADKLGADKRISKRLTARLISGTQNILSNLTAYELNNLTAKSLIRDNSLCTTCGKCASVCETGATQIIGKEMTSEDVMKKVIQDKPFFDNSEGGVTFSGGEPACQKAFLLDMLSRSKEAGIHTAIETCGYFDERLIDELLPLTDLFLFDLKALDAARHKALTGKDNKKILDNFISILNKAGAKRIVPRIPLIPGINTDEASIEAFAGFLLLNGYQEEVNLMPYNSLYKTKFEKIGRGVEYNEFGKLDEDEIRQITTRFASYGLRAVCQK
jgi:pyruvate formate lyase activating enzyme